MIHLIIWRTSFTFRHMICNPLQFWSTDLLSFIYDRMINSHFWSTFKLFDCAVCIQIQSETGSKLHSNQVTINFRLQISGSKMACMSYCIICMTSFKSKMDQKFIWDNPMQHFCRLRRCKSFSKSLSSKALVVALLYSLSRNHNFWFNYLNSIISSGL